MVVNFISRIFHFFYLIKSFGSALKPGGMECLPYLYDVHLLTFDISAYSGCSLTKSSIGVSREAILSLHDTIASISCFPCSIAFLKKRGRSFHFGFTKEPRNRIDVRLYCNRLDELSKHKMKGIAIKLNFTSLTQLLHKLY